MNAKKQDSISMQKMYNLHGPETAQLFDNLIWGIDHVCAFSKYAKGTIYNLVRVRFRIERVAGRRD